MDALPRDLSASSGTEPTGLACPDCAGALEVKTDGHRGHLRFRCRIGHVYALSDLLTAKEERLEDRLWSALLSLQELADLLAELRRVADGLDLDRASAGLAERGERARASAARLRAIIGDNRSLEITEDIELIRAPSGPP